MVDLFRKNVCILVFFAINVSRIANFDHINLAQVNFAQLCKINLQLTNLIKNLNL